jgi:hypothetical protein
MDNYKQKALDSVAAPGEQVPSEFSDLGAHNHDLQNKHKDDAIVKYINGESDSSKQELLAKAKPYARNALYGAANLADSAGYFNTAKYFRQLAQSLGDVHLTTFDGLHYDF